MEDHSRLELCLSHLNDQTQKPDEVIILDDSEIKDRQEIINVCSWWDVMYTGFPYVDHSMAFARKFNTGFKMSTGDAIVLLCSNWLLDKNWIEGMTDSMERHGNNCVIACDNSRKHIDDGSGNMIEWFAGRPDEFREMNPNMMDSAFLMMIHRDYWLPWDEDFDPDPHKPEEWEEKANWHGITEWANRLMRNDHIHLWMKRDLKATHQEIPRWPNPNKWLKQISNSEALMRSKI